MANDLMKELNEAQILSTLFLALLEAKRVYFSMEYYKAIRELFVWFQIGDIIIELSELNSKLNYNESIILILEQSIIDCEVVFLLKKVTSNGLNYNLDENTSIEDRVIIRMGYEKKN